MITFARYGILTLIYYPLSYMGILLGGWWTWGAMLVIIASQILVDNITYPDRKIHKIKKPSSLNILLYLHFPMGIITVLLMLWQAAPGDIFGIGNLLSSKSGQWIIETHNNYTSWDLIGCVFLGGFILSSNTIVGHELVHRMSKPMDLLIGRWLLAINCDAQFSISHVYGHHPNIGTEKDPATARRGENFYTFLLRSAIGQYIEAYELEKRRLQNRNKKIYSLNNRLLTGIGMSFSIIIIC